jgi:hypothetical protein
MPSKASRKKKASKNMANKPKATANKDDLEGIDDLLNDPEVMQNIQLPEISGQRSAQIGLEGCVAKLSGGSPENCCTTIYCC